MAKSNEQKRSRRQEQETAKEIKGRVTPASGSRWHQKADVRSGKFLIECKTTTKDSYRLTAKAWEKIYKEALRDGLKEPVMRIDLRTEYGDEMSFAVTAGTYVLDYLATIVTDVDCIQSIAFCEGEYGSFIIRADLVSVATSTLKVNDKLYRVTVLPWKGFLHYEQSGRG